jgi:DNA repair protein RadA/Sms
MAVAAALVSSLAGSPLPSDCVYFGEISLSGSIRPVAQTGLRLKEAQKLGFESAILPNGSVDVPKNGGNWQQIDSLTEMVAKIASGSTSSNQDVENNGDVG